MKKIVLGAVIAFAFATPSLAQSYTAGYGTGTDRHAASREDEWRVWILRDSPVADGQNCYDLSRGKRHFRLRLFPADFPPSQDSQQVTMSVSRIRRAP